MSAHSDEKVLGAVSDEPASATVIFLRLAGLPPQKSLTTRLRKQRRGLAQTLERLASEGQLKTGIGTEHPVPVYWRVSREDRFLDAVDDLQTDRRERLGR